MTAYIWVFLACAGTTFAVTPIVRRLALRFGAVDQPSDRKVHPKATPTMGGIAMYVGFLVGLGLSQVLPFFSRMNHGSAEPLAALVTCTAMVGLGAIDDKRGVSALAKLTAQVLIGGGLVLLGVQVLYFWFGPGAGIVSVSSDLAVPLTILWLALVVNAVNLVDGLDGLAAGMVAIAAAAFFIYMVRTESLFGDASAAALLSAITVGICVGFLPWNFYPARIFMGDSGSMLLGMLLTIATISGVARNPFPPSGGDLAAVVGTVMVPLLVLAIPFLDVVLAVHPADVAREGDRHGRQGAHPSPAAGHRTQPPVGRPPDVPVERPHLRERARDRPDRRPPRGGRDHRVGDRPVRGDRPAAAGPVARPSRGGGRAGRRQMPRPRRSTGTPRIHPPETAPLNGSG